MLLRLSTILTLAETNPVKDKDGKTKTEPVCEYGRNRPSVVINGAAGVRLELLRPAGGSPIADETARHSVREERLLDASPPAREARAVSFDLTPADVSNRVINAMRARGKSSPPVKQ